MWTAARLERALATLREIWKIVVERYYGGAERALSVWLGSNLGAELCISFTSYLMPTNRDGRCFYLDRFDINLNVVPHPQPQERFYQNGNMSKHQIKKKKTGKKEEE